MGKLSKNIGQRIKEIREGLNIKQFELAEMLEMEPSNLTRIENGYQFPKEENLLKIAEKLGVSVKELFDFRHIKPRSELIKLINNSFNEFSDEEIAFCYRIIISLKEMKE